MIGEIWMYNFFKGYSFSFSGLIAKEGFTEKVLTRPPSSVTFFFVNMNENFSCSYACDSDKGCDLCKALCPTRIKNKAACPKQGDMPLQGFIFGRVARNALRGSSLIRHRHVFGTRHVL
jgi:hypothetical protein